MAVFRMNWRTFRLGQSLLLLGNRLADSVLPLSKSLPCLSKPLDTLTLFSLFCGCLPFSILSLSNADIIEIRDGGYERQFEVFWSNVNGTVGLGEMLPFLGDSQTQAPIEWHRYSGSPAIERTRFRLVLYEKNVERTVFTRRIVTDRILVLTDEGEDISRLVRAVGAIKAKGVDYAPGYHIFSAGSSTEALQLALRLRAIEGVRSAEPLLGRRAVRKFVPNDPLFLNQWHLLNWGQFGGVPRVDVNVTNVWDRFRGNGVVVAIVDDGLQRTHPDLSKNIRVDVQYDFRDGDNDPSPTGTDDFHGTSIAGIVAGRGNNDIGVTGVAFEASLVGVRLVGGIDQTDDQEAMAMLQGNQVISVSNNAWGAEDTGRSLEGPGPLLERALEQGVREGRGGKGTIFVWAGGNGAEVQDDANYDGYANSMFTIAVGSVNDLGRLAGYSEPGACLVVVTPSGGSLDSDRRGIVTTDLTGDEGLNYSGAPKETPDINYSQTFSGTSASSAVLSGVVALVLEANPDLGWRDVQEILMRSATEIEHESADWTTNQAGFHFNHSVGAGLVNAGAAVGLATNWTVLGSRTNIVFEQKGLSASIPDNSSAAVTRSFFVPSSRALRAEHVTLSVSIQHSRRGDLAISLISPHGTESRLAERHSDFNEDYRDWKFMSVFHWGESTAGQWQVKILDQRTRESGVLESVRLELFGTPLLGGSAPILLPLSYRGSEFRFEASGNGDRPFEVQVSSDLIQWTSLIRTNAVAGGSVELVDGTAGAVPQRFYRVIAGPVQ